MKKYKLKIDLGGKKAGYLHQHNAKYYGPGRVSWTDENNITYESSLTNPKIWEEVKELEFEILSFIVRPGAISFAKQGEIISPVGKGGVDGAWKSESGAAYSYSYLIDKTAMYDIHSVKRLSDGEVFTLGDKVVYEGRTSTLGGMKINTNYTQTIYTWPKEGGWGQNFDKLSKPKKAILTTEDGVAIYYGETYWAVRPDLSIFSVTAFDGLLMLKDYKRFSTKELAEAYVESNKHDFITEDGVKVKFGTDVYWVMNYASAGANPDYKYLYKLELKLGTAKLVQSSNNLYKVFSTEKAAKDYVAQFELIDVKLTKAQVKKLEALLK